LCSWGIGGKKGEMEGTTRAGRDGKGGWRGDQEQKQRVCREIGAVSTITQEELEFRELESTGMGEGRKGAA